MERVAYPRARGTGRAPQIGPGTFDARSFTEDVKPAEFGAVAWSMGSSQPDVELWCYLAAAGQEFVPLAPNGANSHVLWLDRVADVEAFNPPANPLGNEVELALKAYTNSRYRNRHGGSFTVSDWKVQVARPYNVAPTNIGSRKVGIGLYSVEQVDFGTGIPPTSWVWSNGTREIWVLYRPGQLDGFCLVGTEDPRTQQRLDSTELKVRALDSALSLDLNQYGKAIAELKKAITDSAETPTTDPLDLVVHDYRVASEL